jgi:hypothetical protein
MTPTPCALFVGFLLPRACENVSIGACGKCGRTVCEAHARVSQAGLLCTACETGSEFPASLAVAAAVAGTAPLFLPTDIAAFEAAGVDEQEDDAFADLS